MPDPLFDFGSRFSAKLGGETWGLKPRFQVGAPSFGQGKNAFPRWDISSFWWFSKWSSHEKDLSIDLDTRKNKKQRGGRL